ncbi:hypothetical protein DFJ77DRAFT_451358 [Powellomyces hirtus]|nr:hypothetical protein DFJ77DRAFT_451358 [Powellomyces hirtus]
MDNFEHIANMSIGGMIAMLVTTVTFIDQIEKIRNKFLLCSILGYSAMMTSACICSNQAWRRMIAGELPQFASRMIATQFFYVGAFTCLIFHSTYRTVMISAPHFASPLRIAIPITLTQCFIHGSASYYWGSNIMDNYGTKVSVISSRFEIAILIYYSVVESVLFLLTQYKIIQVKSVIVKKGDSEMFKIKLLLYLKGSIRSFAYILNIVLIYIALGNWLPYLVNWNYPMFCPAFLLMIVLTDSTRFQECMAKLSVNHAPRTSGSGFKETDTAGSSSKMRAKQTGTVTKSEDPGV